MFKILPARRGFNKKMPSLTDCYAATDSIYHDGKQFYGLTYDREPY